MVAIAKVDEVGTKSKFLLCCADFWCDGPPVFVGVAEVGARTARALMWCHPLATVRASPSGASWTTFMLQAQRRRELRRCDQNRTRSADSAWPAAAKQRVLCLRLPTAGRDLRESTSSAAACGADGRIPCLSDEGQGLNRGQAFERPPYIKRCGWARRLPYNSRPPGTAV